MFEALQHFHLLRPGWLLLSLPWVFICWQLYRRSHGKDKFRGIIAPHLLEHLRVNPVGRGWFNPLTMTMIITALMTVVMAGPTWRQQPSPLSQDEAALVVVLDVSASMTQRDVQPSRLVRARQKIGDLLEARSGSKTALVVYAGSAHTVLTLTPDETVMGQYLSAIEPGIMPRPGKFPEYALAEVDQVLRQSDAPATVLLVADGTGADSAAAFETYFEARPHQLLVLGVGSDAQTEGLIPLERDALKALAEAGDGRYFDMTVNDSDVQRIDRRIDAHYVVLDDSALPWLDSGYYLVFPCLAIFLLWFRTGWTLRWCWLLLPFMLGLQPAPVLAEAAPEPEAQASHWFADLWLTPDQQGRRLLARGVYRAAAQRFADPMWKGLAWYYAEEFMLAAEYFSRSDSDDALFNEANARAHARDYMRAVNRYDRLLARSPGYPGAAQNRDTVQALIDEINRLSESQQSEPGTSGEDKELGGDDAVPAMGADEISWEQAELQQLSAQDILQDPATSEMWLRGVQQDPSDFLAVKFGMQLQRREDAGGGAP